MNASTHANQGGFVHDTIWPIIPSDLIGRLRDHVTTGGQVDYHGSLADLHGTYTIVGQCACDRCVGDHLEWERFRLVLDNGDTEITCVRQVSVSARQPT